MMETLRRLVIPLNVREIFKTVISKLQISAMLGYGKDCFRRICKGIKINKGCCYM